MKASKSLQNDQSTATEKALRLAFDTTPAFIHTARPDGYFDYFNRRWLDFLGKSLEDVCGWRWTKSVHPEDVGGIVQKWRAALASGEPFEAEARVRCADGTSRAFLHRKVPLHDEHGNIVKWFGSSIDIEDRKHAEKRRSLETELQATLNVIPAYTWYALPSGALTFVNQRTADYLGLPKDHPLRLGIHTGAEWDSHVPFLHPDDHEETRRNWSTRLRTSCAGEGSFRVRNAEGGYRWFLSRVEPLRASDGTLLYWVGVNLDIEERKRAEEELRRSEAYLSEAQSLSHTGSFGWKPDTGETIWSGETYRIFEYDRAVTPTVDLVVQRVHPEDRADVQSVIERASGGAPGFEHAYRLLMPDGRVKHVHALAHATQDASGNREFIGAVTDITERKTTEDKIRRLVEAGILGIFFANVDGRIVEANQAFLQLLQYDREDLVSGRLRWADLTPVEWRERDERSLTEFLETGVFHYEKEYFRKDGSRVSVLVGGARLQSPNEGVVYVLDLSEQKRAEEALRSSEAYLAEAQRLSHTGSWAWSLTDGIRYWSDECYRVLGFDPREGPPRFEEFFQRIHPDDQVQNWEVTRKAISEKVDVEVEYRIVHPDGAVRDIHSTGHPVLGPSGDLIELMGTVIDITERKRAEEELRASERKYRDLVDTTPAFVHTALPNGELDFFNRGWLEYLGVPINDLLGWGWTSAIHPEDVEALVSKWRAALESEEPLVAESRVRRADGEYRWFLHRKRPQHNELGEVVKWYGSSIEIQERKVAEQRIREQETELRQILDLTPQHIGVLAPDGSRLYANHTALEYFGVTLEQWRDPNAHMKLAHPEDREHFLAERNKRFLEGEPHEFEARLLRHDGEFRCFLFRLTPLKDERGHITRWYGTATDIEERKRAEEGLRKENIALREVIAKASMFEEIVGDSPALQQVLVRVAKVAPTDSTVLIIGETGTGKELIARAIHKTSKRSQHAFISLNCAAVPSSLIMSELFGHEKGAFTGALQRRLGRFELAEGGTLFLDEVGDLPLETQIALLRVLQEREFERVGGTEVLRADVRVIAATNRDLQAAIADGAFRSDLYYRLNVFPIDVPPLRERKNDVPLLVNYFVDRYAKRAGKKIERIQKKALEALQEYSWPGNVRELQNVIERSLIIGETNEFSIDESWVANESQPPTPATDRTLTERTRIEAALAQSNGKVAGAHGAAAKLGMPPSTLESKIRSLGINKFQFKGV